MKNNKMKNIFFMVNSIRGGEKNGSTLAKSMDYVAKNSSLNRQTVKSYYYKTLKYLNENPVVAKSLNIKLPKKKEFEVFCDREKNELFDKITQNKKKGISVRHTCYMLAHGDAKIMLRLQNKYKSKKKIFDKREKKTMDDTKIKKDQENGSQNIINITSAKKYLNKSLSDSDITALFFGLLNLVKKSIYEKVSKDFEKENKDANNNFRKSIIEVQELETRLKKEQQKNLEMSSLIENQKMQICKLIKNLSGVNGQV